MSWEEWFQGVAGGVIEKAASAKYVQPYEIQKLQLQALGETGYYTEGEPATVARATPATSWLVLGGLVLVAVLVLKD